MPEQSNLDRRLRAVERALTDGDHDVAALEDAAAFADRLDALEARIGDLEEQTAELDAATQAVRGYVGNIRSVNDEIEDRADAALAAVDRIEARLDQSESLRRGTERGPTEAAPTEQSSTDPRRTGDDRQRVNRTPTGRQRGSNETTAGGRLAGDGYGIEMPPPGAESSSPRPSEDEQEEGRSVIDRVREAL